MSTPERDLIVGGQAVIEGVMMRTPNAYAIAVRKADGTIAGIGDVSIQTRQVLDNVKAAVEEAGGTLEDICRVDVYVRNIEHFDAIHKVRREYFPNEAPASTMVEVSKMVKPEYLIEISAIAVLY